MLVQLLDCHLLEGFILKILNFTTRRYDGILPYNADERRDCACFSGARGLSDFMHDLFGADIPTRMDADGAQESRCA